MKFPRNAKLLRSPFDVAPFAAVFFLMVIFLLLMALLPAMDRIMKSMARKRPASQLKARRERRAAARAGPAKVCEMRSSATGL